MTGILIRWEKVGYRHTGQKAMWRWRQRLEQCIDKPTKTKSCQEPPEARKGQGRILPYQFQRGHGSANTLISDRWPLFEIINFCCPKPPCLSKPPLEMSTCSSDKPLLSVYYEPNTTKGSEESQVNQTQQSFPLPAWSYGSPFFCQRNEATQLVHGNMGTTGHGFRPPLQGPPTHQAKGSLVFWSLVTVKERHLSPFHQGKKKCSKDHEDKRNSTGYN